MYENLRSATSRILKPAYLRSVPICHLWSYGVYIYFFLSFWCLMLTVTDLYLHEFMHYAAAAWSAGCIRNCMSMQMYRCDQRGHIMCTMYWIYITILPLSWSVPSAWSMEHCQKNNFSILLLLFLGTSPKVATGKIWLTQHNMSFSTVIYFWVLGLRSSYP